jgi:hypothetical protein
LPTFAQQNTPDPQVREKLIVAIKKHTDALDRNDAAAVAANFTENGILVTPNGTISGREANRETLCKRLPSKDSIQARIPPLQMTVHLTS